MLLESRNAALQRVIDEAPKPPMTWHHLALTDFTLSYEGWWKSRRPAQISGQSSPAGERAAKPSVFTPPKYDQEYWDAMAKLDDLNSGTSDNGQHEGALSHLTTELIQMAEDYRLAANSVAYRDIQYERAKLETRIWRALHNFFRPADRPRDVSAVPESRDTPASDGA
jgi:hypothetical protein